jgi:hypothetical protein
MTELTTIERAQFERDEDNRQRRWVESIIHRPCGEAARAAAARQGDALLLWIDASGEFRAQRIQRDASILREFVPAFINRGNKT